MDDAEQRVIRATLDPRLRAGIALTQPELRTLLGVPQIGGAVDLDPTTPPAAALHAVEIGVRSTGDGELAHEVALLRIPPTGTPQVVTSWRHDVSAPEVAAAAAAVKAASANNLRRALLDLVEALTRS